MQDTEAKNKIIKIYGIYTHSTPADRVFYVGKGPEKRSRCMKRSYNKWHQSTIDKYGAENIKVTFLEGESEEIALRAEQILIAYYRLIGVQLVNLTNGGEGMSGHKQSKETLEKRSAKLKGQKRTLEQCANIKAGGPGIKKGTKLSEEHKQKIKLNSGARYKSPEWLKNQGLGHRGKKLSKEHAEKLLNAAIQVHLGKTQKEQTKEKISQTLLNRNKSSRELEINRIAETLPSSGVPFVNRALTHNYERLKNEQKQGNCWRIPVGSQGYCYYVTELDRCASDLW